MAINQAYLFLIFTLNGILIGFLFDFFRILRKSFKTTNFITYVEDIIFWILTGLSIIFFMYNFSDGNLRLFIFLGLGFGIILYMLTLSRAIIKISVSIINFFVKIIKKTIDICKIPCKFIYKLILKPIHFLFSKFQKNSKNFKIFRGKCKQMEKNNIEVR